MTTCSRLSTHWRLAAGGTIGRLDFKETSYTDEWNRPQRLIELTERGALIAMPFVGGRNSRIGQVRLVDAFLAMREALAERKTVTWTQARQEAAANYSVVSEMLRLRREAEGKSTVWHHYANEAKAINEALTGKRDAINRNTLSADELRILKKLETRDAALIGMGKAYAERKELLAVYAGELRGMQALEVEHG